MRLLLFDIDGTLVLTGGAGSRAMTRAFAQTHGLEDALKKVDLAGRTDRIIMRDALTQAGLPHEDVDVDAFRTAYCARAARGDRAAGQRPPRPAAGRAAAARRAGRPRRRAAGAAHRQLPRVGRDQAGRSSTCGATSPGARSPTTPSSATTCIAVAHARHETEHGHVDRARRRRDHRRHAARHPLRPRRRGQGGRGRDRQLRPGGAARAPNVLFANLTDTDAFLRTLE